MKTTQILFAGFGGQGVLFAGKFLAYKGLMEELQVSWLPSYGPEMRGGTANCSVVLSDTPVGSPIITNPDGSQIKTTEMLALNIFNTYNINRRWHGTAQAKAVIFFVLLAVLALAQQYMTRKKEVQQ